MSKVRLSAAIDIGSNSLTLKVAEASKRGSVRILETVRGALSLGSSSYRDGVISDEQMEDLSRQLLGFRNVLDTYNISVDECPVVATSALRESANRDLVIERIRQTSGFRVRILGNTEERSLHLTAVRAQLEAFEEIAQEGVTVLDIGAGSLQVSVFDEGHCYYSQNFLLGALRLSELFAQFELRARDYESLVDEYIRSELANSDVSNPSASNHPHLLALGVDLSAIHSLRKRKNSKDPFVTQEEFNEIFERIRHLSSFEISQKMGIVDEIAETLLPAMIVVKQYLDASNAPGVYVPSVHICEAIIYRTLRSAEQHPLLQASEQDLIATSRFLATRFQDDLKHSRFVTEVALSIFRSLRNRYGFDRRFGVLLELLGILHDIGKAISLRGHAENSSSIVERNEFLGLTEREKEILSEMIRFHSGTKPPVLQWGSSFTSEERRQIISAIAILRLADSIDASQRQKLQDWEINLRKDTLIITGRCKEDFRMESWSLTDKSTLFKQYFNLDVRLRVEEYSL